ncbi:MAG: hypothetical protein NXY57DRAFT_968837 [Lentinula lateritia]|nr:MAG: hypothetical protein NXY57DRAFT_968837 [Lentinula lateritia]
MPVVRNQRLEATPLAIARSRARTIPFSPLHSHLDNVLNNPHGFRELRRRCLDVWLWPVVDGRRLTPDELADHEHLIMFCLCGKIDGVDHCAHIFRAATGVLTGQYVAACAAYTCGYFIPLEKFFNYRGVHLRGLSAAEAVPHPTAAEPARTISIEEEEEVASMLSVTNADVSTISSPPWGSAVQSPTSSVALSSPTAPAHTTCHYARLSQGIDQQILQSISRLVPYRRRNAFKMLMELDSTNGQGIN